ncbi:MAG: SWIM zinc finger family protein [Actinomycetota bacterium]
MSRFLSRAGQAVAELAELSVDEGRLFRGRALFRKGSVGDLVIADGSITASVRGSQGDGYQTSISTALAPPGVRRQVADGLADDRSVDDLIDDGVDVCPREIDLAFECDCPDWEEPCKHVAAVLFAFADRVDLDEAELLRWRGLEPPPATATSVASATAGARSTTTPDATAESEPNAEAEPSTAGGPDADGVDSPAGVPATSWRSRRPRSSEHLEAADDGDRSARLARLQSLLGDTAMRVPAGGVAEPEAPAPLEPALAAFLGVDDEPVGPVDTSDLVAASPLFAGVELGPLASLGPELATALAIIADRLDDRTTED